MTNGDFTNVVGVGIVKCIDDGWLGCPLVLIHRSPEALLILMGIETEHVKNVQQKIVLRHVQLKKLIEYFLPLLYTFTILRQKVSVKWISIRLSK